MNPLVKKEVRLLLPSWIIAVLLAMVQVITRPYDFYIVALLFLGMTMMALTSIGRESSLNTFSIMLAQPAERIRIWQTKLSVLAVVFLITFGVWLLAYGIALFHSTMSEDDLENSYNLFITVCLIATATFTGGLWTTLLLRQLAAAFWLTLLLPATLSGFTAAFVSQSHTDSGVIAVLCVIFAIYSIGGFFFARWLFFRAQDVGWSGGNLELPEWKIFARPENAVSLRNRKPVFALFKKELQLHQATLMGAAGLLALHIGILVLRKYHHFSKDSAGEVLTSIFWLLWLIIPVVIGNLAVAEERRLGVMEGQLCLPVSRRVQFAIKGILTLLLGTFLGGVMPMLLESIGVGLGANSEMFKAQNDPGGPGFIIIAALAAWLSLVSFFASTLAKTFLQAIGFAIVTFVGWAMLISGFAVSHRLIYGSFPTNSILPLVISTPTIIITLLRLAWLNFNNFRDGWPLWRRNLLGAAGAFVFVIVASAGIYNRAWEIFEPAEPVHGPAIFSLANPPVIHHQDYSDDLLLQLPDGRVWFDQIGYNRSQSDFQGRAGFRELIRATFNPFPINIGPQRFLTGSNWVSSVIRHIDNWPDQFTHITGYLEAVGIQSDGTLWVSEKSNSQLWNGDKLMKFGDETNWQAVSWRNPEFQVMLLKKDGTLWCWGIHHYDWREWPTNLPALRSFNPYQVGTNSDWKKISFNSTYLQKNDGSVWLISVNPKSGKYGFSRDTNWDQVDFEKIPQTLNPENCAYVRTDGTLWVSIERWNPAPKHPVSETFQMGKETNWVSAASSGWMMGMVVALKSDGTLWKWFFNPQNARNVFAAPPIRVGIHNDWVAITAVENGVVTLAADGSLWLWPDWASYQYPPPLLKLPKQPQFLANIFGKTD